MVRLPMLRQVRHLLLCLNVLQQIVNNLPMFAKPFCATLVLFEMSSLFVSFRTITVRFGQMLLQPILQQTEHLLLCVSDEKEIVNILPTFVKPFRATWILFEISFLFVSFETIMARYGQMVQPLLQLVGHLLFWVNV